MRKSTLVVVAGSFLISAASVFAESGASQILPRNWVPDVSSIIDRLNDELEQASAQQEMNQLSREIADLLDARLYVVYTHLSERLNAQERTKLVQEQASWLKARIRHGESAVVSEGGSLAAYEANSAEANFTTKRIQELQRRLSAREPKKN